MEALFIAYHFPPTGGAGTQRSAKFARYFGRSDIHTTVIAGPGPAGSRWEPEDSTLTRDIPSDVRVVRTQPADGGANPTWAGEILSTGRDLITDNEPDVILVTMSPFAGLEPALALGNEFGIPVVADLRDPWALDETKKYRTRVHRRKAVRAMGGLLRRCTAIVMNTPEAMAAVHDAFPDITTDRISVVPNGFDTNDMQDSADLQNRASFTIVHTGYLHTELAEANLQHAGIKRWLGGSLWPVDVSTRSHIHLLRAIEFLESAAPDLARRTRVVLAGVLTDTDRRIVENSSVRDQVDMTGYVSHSEAISLMKGADALFLPLHDIPPSRRSRIVPGKTYEYLASRTPIIAALPEGDAKDMVISMHAGLVVAPDDAPGIATAIQTIDRDSTSFSNERPGLQAFERSAQASDMADILTWATMNPLVV